MKQMEQNHNQEKPVYIKPRVVVSYTKEELKSEFKELQGQSAFVDSTPFIVDFKGGGS